MEKIWLKSYEPRVPEFIDPNQYISLVDYADKCSQEYGEKTSFSNFGTGLSYQKLQELSQAFAGTLQATLRLNKGDRVAVMMPNLLQYPVSILGILKAGMTVVNVNPLYTPRELKRILVDSGAKCIIVLANFAHVLQEVLQDTQLEYVVVTEIGDLLGGLKGSIFNFVTKHVKKMVPPWHIPNAYSFKQVVEPQNKALYQPVALTHEDIAFLQYTGGTTGGAKGAMLTHGNMLANIIQVHTWLQSLIKQKLEGGLVNPLPLYHIFSLLASLLFLKVGIEIILITNPRDIPHFVKELRANPFSILIGVNTLFNALLKNDDFHKLNFSKLKFALGGGMAVQKVVAERWKKATGVVLLEAYGLTETSPGATFNPLNLQDFNGTIGLPLPSTEVKIIDDKGQELPIGQAGELCIRGPQVMKGYWKQPEKTKEVLDEAGWLRTGDIATINEAGFVKIIDRKKDMIIVSGFNVYPNEIEDVIAEIKGVREVAVVGVKSEAHGEIVKAFVVSDEPKLTQSDIIEYCKKNLTAYKIPKIVEFRKELPKSNVGKILRRELREE